jgi:hypothetical protein
MERKPIEELIATADKIIGKTKVDMALFAHCWGTLLIYAGELERRVGKLEESCPTEKR